MSGSLEIVFIQVICSTTWEGRFSERAARWSAVDLDTDLMGSRLTTLTASDIQRFERDGYVVVRQAFSRADGLAMERQWWRELEDTHGIRPDDRSSWRQIVGDLKAAKRDPVQAKILTKRGTRRLRRPARQSRLVARRRPGLVGRGAGRGANRRTETRAALPLAEPR